MKKKFIPEPMSTHDFLVNLKEKFGAERTLDLLIESSQKTFLDAWDSIPENVPPKIIERLCTLFVRQPTEQVLLKNLNEDEFTPVDNISETLSSDRYWPVDYVTLSEKYLELEKQHKVQLGENEYGLCVRLMPDYLK